MADELKNIIFNVSKEESEAIAKNKTTDWNEDFFPVSAKTIRNKALIILGITIGLCAWVYSISSHDDESDSTAAAAKVSTSKYVDLDD